MVGGEDLYKVVSAMVPLYVAMLMGYGSVKWWRIFTPEQCAGVNRFATIFAVPVLSFHFISHHNPYRINGKFIIADSMFKILLLVVLGVWAKFSTRGSLEWLITLFSIASLPSTLVIGIPLLIAMYGESTLNLMVQLVILQCIIWYTLLLFLFEYRGAKLLVLKNFPQTAGSITSFEVESNVISLNGAEALQTETEIRNDGKIHVRIVRSPSSESSNSTQAHSSSRRTLQAANPVTPSSADLFSAQSSLQGRGSNLSEPDFSTSTYLTASPRHWNLTCSDDYNYCSEGHRTPRTPNPNSNSNELKHGDRDGVDPWTSRVEESPEVLQVAICRSDPARNHHDENDDTELLQVPSYSDVGSSSPYLGEEFRSKFRVYRGYDSVIDINNASPNARSRAENLPKMPGSTVMLKLVLTMVGRKLARSPNTYASLLGLIWSLVSFRWNLGMPMIIEYSVKILSDTALGMAMFGLGLSVALQDRIIACDTKLAILGMAVRFLAAPAIMSAVSFAVRLRDVVLYTSIIQIALPQGIVPFVFAREYSVHPDIITTVVMFGMLISLPIMLLYYILLGL